jgi:xylulokinase
VLLGIDIGTTGVRAAVVDHEGRIVADVSEPCPASMPEAGHAEIDAERWWVIVGQLTTRLARLPQLAHLAPGPGLGQPALLGAIEAIGVTGQAPTAVLVDDHGRPTGPALLWLDVRAADEARALDVALGPGGAEAIGGNRMHAYWLGPKLSWIRRHAPARLDRARWVLQSHAFVVHRLTGEAVCDRSTAMLCAPLFDARAQSWSAEGAAAAGVDPRILPPVVRAHDVVGAVTRDAARATGLREGTPVVAGGGDFAASALGAGVLEEGEACLMLGTAGNLLLPRREPVFDPRLINSHHVGSDRWLSLGGTLCGAALEWFRGACAPDVPWDTLEREAGAVAVGAEGLTVLPYFQGERTPIWDEQARAVFFGATLRHGRGHLYRAVLDGIAASFRHCLAVAAESGLRCTEVVATNGAGRSPLLRQALTDALEVPLTWVGDGGGTVLGAAILAGMGIGVWPDGAIARRARDRATHVARHAPDPQASAAFRALLDRRVDLYEALRGRF